MPTNRVRIKRAVRSRVSDEARAMYADAVKLRDRYWDCIASVACHSPSINEKCPECVKYVELSSELNRKLGIKPWETSPLCTDTESPPDYMRDNPWQSGLWHKAWAMRCELEGAGVEAAIAEFNQRKAAT